MILSNPDNFIVTQKGKDLIVTLKEKNESEETYDSTEIG